VLGTEAGPLSTVVVVHGRLLGAYMRVDTQQKRGLRLEPIDGIYPVSVCLVSSISNGPVI